MAEPFARRTSTFLTVPNDAGVPSSVRSDSACIRACVPAEMSDRPPRMVGTTEARALALGGGDGAQPAAEAAAGTGRVTTREAMNHLRCEG